MVIDHTSYSISEIEGDHTLIASDNLIKSDVILGKQKIEVRFPHKFAVLFHGCVPYLVSNALRSFLNLTFRLLCCLEELHIRSMLPIVW